jgi:hypothetical protein
MNMTEKAAKKIGEVHAFAVVAGETVVRGREAMIKALGAETLAQYEIENQSHQAKIEELAKRLEVESTVMIKSEATQAKLRAMRDLYVKDEWDNPAELMEWSGFFEGAALVHWALVSGVAEWVKNDELTATVTAAITFHQNILDKVRQSLEAIGRGFAAVSS